MSEAAFARAAQARDAIEQIISSVRDGKLDLAGAFAAGDADALTGRCFAVKVFEVVPGIGKVRARRTMADLDLDEGIWLGDVAIDDRTRVIQAFADV